MKAVLSSLIVVLASACLYGQTVRTISWPQFAQVEPRDAGENGKLRFSDVNALELIALTVNGKEIIIGQPFLADREWLKTLAVTVRNTSNKPISAIRLSFGLPEAKYGDGISGFSLEYGKELSTGIDYGPQVPIAPGERGVLIRNEKHYTRDRDGIERRTGATDFRSVLIGNTMVKFTDGTVWMTYKLPSQTRINEQR